MLISHQKSMFFELGSATIILFLCKTLQSKFFVVEVAFYYTYLQFY